MRKLLLLALSCVLWRAQATAAGLSTRLRELLESPTASRAFFGVYAIDLKTGAALIDYQSGRNFVPASNTKLFTTALGLMRLGPEYRFHTTAVAEEPLDSEGRLNGDLSLVGGGDPNLSPRPIPYKAESYSGNPLSAIEDLASELQKKGLRRVNGNIAGDDRRYVWQPYADGWAIGDAVWEYGAPVSAIALNDNTFRLLVRPDGVRTDPPVSFYRIANRLHVEPGVARKVHIERLPGSRELRVMGTLAPGDAGETHLLAIGEPALYAAQALSSALVRRGIIVTGEAVARHALPAEFRDLERSEQPPPVHGSRAVELARRSSAPLLDSIRVIDKVSQNLHAEMLLREVGWVRRNIGSREAGLKELRVFLDEAGVDSADYSWHDGSGLSRLNLVTPRAVVKLLRYMYESPQRENWISLLPIAGEDGTLRKRMNGTAAASRIRAKTGTLSHVTALSGYAERSGGGTLAFSILVNNHPGESAGAREIVDKICSWMVE